MEFLRIDKENTNGEMCPRMTPRVRWTHGVGCGVRKGAMHHELDVKLGEADMDPSLMA